MYSKNKNASVTIEVGGKNTEVMETGVQSAVV